MPTSSVLLAFVVASAAMVAIPGPSVVYVVTRGVEQGRGAAILSMIGLELGALVHLLATAAGLAALLEQWPEAIVALRWAGAGYLLWLGVRQLRGTRAAGTGVSPVRVHASRWHLVRDGMLIDLLNPGTALFFLAFLPQFVDPARGSATGQIVLLGLCFLALAAANDTVYALASGSLGARLTRLRPAGRWMGGITGGVYVALAGVALVV
ncbi:LysE family translocator [Georgenia alba]|uniref:LysE family translocator n=1 Tax=Georgenia alba TaxID=2233858 RepID=A0ABW2Q520_9MICO